MRESAADIFRVRPDDEEYLVRARAEAEYWARSNAPGLSDAAAGAGGGLGQSHYNRRYTGDGSVHWFETIARYGEFRKGLVLGAGGITQEARILETNPSLDLTVLDISAGALASREEELASRFPGRVATGVADFNFIDLPEAAYDLIVSSSAIHHVMNLEHLAYQVNRALTPDGYFFLDDYVGESLRRFTPEKKLAFELIYNRELTRQGRRPSSLEWSNGDDRSSPFCGVRSAEILSIFRTYLREVDVRTAGALWYPLLFARDVRPPPPQSLRWRIVRIPGIRKVSRWIGRHQTKSSEWFFNPIYIQQLLDVSDRLTDAGELLPTNAFAVYQKDRGAGE
jgi:SAM-dependent methyltransferase